MKTSRKNELKALKKTLNDLGQPTWFDVGIFLDKLAEERSLPANEAWKPETFLHTLSHGIAFIAFDYGIDGVTIETAKYAEALESVLSAKGTGESKVPTIHWIAETFKPESNTTIKKRWKKFILDGGGGFVGWDGYQDFFQTTLKRGSDEYNRLIVNLWQQTKQLCVQLGEYVVKNDIELLFPVNVCSNPGNVALALSIVIVSEKLKIPVFNNCHDFFWENGSPEWKNAEDAPGLRDHFFRNAHLGEVQSLVENLFPWDSPLWFHTTLNNNQKDTLVQTFGISPANLATIPTVIDPNKYKPVRKDDRLDILGRAQVLLAASPRRLRSESVVRYVDSPIQSAQQSRPLFLGAEDGLKCNLSDNNLLFVQPTRILARKDISRGLDLINALLGHEPFRDFLDVSNHTITLLVTGPVTQEHVPYLNQLLSKFNVFLDTLPPSYRNRVFLSFKFGLETNKSYQKQGYAPLLIHEIYSVASMVLLPSHQEGRGLPLLESSACAVPIMTNRFEPEDVFKEVTGEDMDAALRLRVFEFPEGTIFPSKTLDKLTNIFANYYYNHGDLLHNVEVIAKRFTQTALEQSFVDNLASLALSVGDDPAISNNIKDAFLENSNATSYDETFKQLTLSHNRKYLPGITELEYMVQLKSLIDPSSFRMEEKAIRGRIFHHAQKRVDRQRDDVGLTPDLEKLFFKHVRGLFDLYLHDDERVVDHSFSYRHRHTKHYPYRKVTEPELCGVVGILFRKIIRKQPSATAEMTFARCFTSSMEGQIRALGGFRNIEIDDTERLVKCLKSHKTIVWFHGGSFTNEITLFVERTLRMRMKLKTEEKLTAALLKKQSPLKIGQVILFAKEQATGRAMSEHHVRSWLATYASDDIKLLYQYGYFKIVSTQIVSSGIHLGQLGKQAAAELLAIKKSKGVVISVGQVNMITLDLLDMDSFRLGTCTTDLYASYMAIKKDAGFIQWVPAGLRPSLAYPTPIQTPVDFSKALGSQPFETLAKKLGRSTLLRILRKDADQFGTPIAQTLKNLTRAKSSANKSTEVVEYNLLTGLHSNGDPWSGAYAKCTMDKHHTFKTVFAGEQGDTVLSIIEKLEEQSNESVSLAWNGGYILNHELVGKLGLPEDYIGSPLGLLLSNRKIKSLPLFNKPALLFGKEGTASIREAHLRDGFSICSKDVPPVVFTPDMRNSAKKGNPAYYDLFFGKKSIPATDRVVFRFAGDSIVERITDAKKVPLLPVGVSVSFPVGDEPPTWKPGLQVSYRIPGWSSVENAIEAGPLLVRDGKESIEMVAGGWKTSPSIATQAARVDYTHMRGPKIAVGITASNELLVVAINGRIRESVGATHGEMAKVLLDRGCVHAMGFDPGGSVTLVVEGKQLNISPYNKDYLFSPYSLPPQPRFVSNAIVAIKN